MDNNKNNETKKELKVVFTDEIYDELKYVFRPDRLENIIYRPALKDEGKWLCTCGFETDLGMCPICGMEKATVFSKVNANYLSRHRKERLAHKQKSGKERKKELAAASTVKSRSSDNAKTKKIGSIVGVAVLLVAIAVCAFFFIYDPFHKNDQPVESTAETTVKNQPEQTSPATKAPDTEVEPQTDETEPVAVDTKLFDEFALKEEDAPYETSIPENRIATTPANSWPEGASGNTSVGGRVFVGSEYDYIAKDGIGEYDKDGNLVRIVTDTEALSLTGDANYIYFADKDHKLRKITYNGKTESVSSVLVDMIAAFDGKLFFTPFEDNGLYSVSPEEGSVRKVANLKVASLNVTAGKLYFSTSESLGVLTSSESAATLFCTDGASSPSVIEYDNAVNYIVEGQFGLYMHNDSPYGRDYGRYSPRGVYGNVTKAVQFNERLYYRIDFGDRVEWFADTVLFAGASSTGVATPELYVTDNGYYDGELNFHSVK